MIAASAHWPPGTASVCADDGHCVTCSDAADPVRVRSVDAALGIAVCEDEHGADIEVMVDLVAPVVCGEVLLVHAGVAIARLGEDLV